MHLKAMLNVVEIIKLNISNLVRAGFKMPVSLSLNIMLVCNHQIFPFLRGTSFINAVNM